MINKKIFYLFVCAAVVLLIGVTSVFAGDGDRTGTAAGVQVLVPVGARDLAMAGSNLANTSGLSAIYWNPAGLSSLNQNATAVFSTMNMFEEVRNNYFALGFKLGKFGSLGLDLKSITFGDIPVTTNEDPDGNFSGTFSPTFVTSGITYSRRLTDAIQVGATGKLIYESAPRISASAFAFDAGIQYHSFGGVRGLSLGLAVKNIGTNMTYGGSALTNRVQIVGVNQSRFVDNIAQQDQLPASVELALGYQRELNENNAVLLAGNFRNNNLGNDGFSFGLEYAYGDLVFLRGGYMGMDATSSADTNYRFALGLGLKYATGGTDLIFDYTYRDSQYFTGNSMFSFMIGF
jgi:hypothetical protein